MPRLLRIHFSSIGHRDARLAPLTIDLRDQAGGAADSVLWLRNGGGKSSIINLFFSVFRPHRNEFLGAAAEGKARRIEDYVKGKDVAFAVTEWDLGENPAGRPRRCVVGRVMSWKGQTRSADPSNLRKLFFTLTSNADENADSGDVLAFDNLPIAGLSRLGDPAATFDAFRDWLRELANARPAAEVVYTDNQRKWNEHLERNGLDPELFRYQIRMNLREGAADEAFRFGTALEFIHFLLELAFETRHADQVAKNLEELRDQFARRPDLELERAFIVEALAALHPLVAAVREHATAKELRDGCLSELAALARALDLRADYSEAAATAATTAADESAAAARVASNERDKRSRWARGLEHLAARLDAEEREARLAGLDELRNASSIELRALRAATVRRDLNRIEAELTELRELLRRAQEQLKPERQRLELAGSALQHALAAERGRLDALLEDLTGRIDVARATCGKKQQHIIELRSELARLSERIKGHQQAIRRRDAARDKLLNDGYLDAREDVSSARARWSETHRDARERSDDLREERARLAERLAENRKRQRVVTGEHERHKTELASAEQALSRALRWRQTLSQNPCLVELEAVDDPDPESPGLEERLRAAANAAATAVLEARVNGAEDERALSSIESTGLLPPPRDVNRVVSSLRARSLNAHAGTAFLAETAPAADRLQQIVLDPARYGGVVISTDQLPADVAAVTEGLDLRSPVQISTARATEAPLSLDQRHVVPPHPASYDHTQAEVVRVALHDQREGRNRRIAEFNTRRRDYEQAADELHRYVEELGRGRLDALQQSRDTAAEQAELAARELATLSEDEQNHEQHLAKLDQRADECAGDIHRAELAKSNLEQFWEQHESSIETIRGDLETSERAERAAQRELAGPAVSELTQAQTRLDALVDERKDRERDRADIEAEAHGIAYVAADSEPGDILLSHARDRYRHLLADWELRTSDNRLQWQIEEITKQAGPLRKELAQLAADLDPDAVAELATEPDLEERIAAAEQADADLRDRRAQAKAELQQAQRMLEEANRRRDAQDLPPTSEQPTPTTAVAARAAAEETRLAMQTYTDEARAADEREKLHRAEAGARLRASERHRSSASQLAALAEGAGLALPEEKPANLPDASDRVDALVEAARETFKAARSRLVQAEQGLHRHCESVRAVATAPRFSELRSQARERMNADTDELTADCDSLATKLTPRLEIIDERLAELDKDRKILVDALQTIGAEAGRLLGRAQRASTLPTSLGAWAGKPYLRIRFQFPETDEEQRARLEPLVDRLVQKAQIPNGLELVKLAVAELAGNRGFEAKVLKPDAVLRPEPISITAMNTFSRGQQLTAAILLYCTLVQLRARSRGRGAGPADAGILLLDNPIGTCSSVPLLELQRTMRARCASSSSMRRASTISKLWRHCPTRFGSATRCATATRATST